MFKTKLKNISIISITIILTLGFSISLQSLLADWSAPTAIAPNNNAAAPLNVGNIGQSKNSGLVLNAGAVNANGLIVQSGKVGIDTTNPNEALTVNGALSLAESTTTPNATAGYGKIYLKNKPETFTDPSTTKLLIHADSSFVDSSGSNKVIDNSGTVVMTTVNKFGGGAAYFNNTSGVGGFLSVSDSDDWYFGTGDFTIDMWYYPLNDSAWRGLFNQHDISNSNGYYMNGLEQSGDGRLRWLIRNGGNVLDLYTAGTISLNQWHHVAAVRIGNTFKIFIDGVERASQALSAVEIQNYNSPMIFGARRDDGNYYYLNAYLDEIRISKGVARWMSNFTPPTQQYSLSGIGSAVPYYKDSVGNETALTGSGSSVSPLSVEYKTCSAGPTLNKASCVATCSSGYQVVGGGCEVVGGLPWNQVYVSKPIADNSGWDCRVSIDWEHADNMSAAGYAICIKQ